MRAARAAWESLAQVDLGMRQNRHQSLRDLSAMAYAVMAAAGARLGAMGSAATPGPLALPPLGAVPGGSMEIRRVVVEERPALRSVTEITAPNRTFVAETGARAATVD